MALVILCGLPLSGKSNLSLKLKKFFEDNKHDCLLISEEDAIVSKKDYLNNAKAEMEMRQKLKAEVNRFVNKSTIVVVDSTNYIKSYRYELFCVAKSHNVKYCVVYCCVSKEHVLELNTVLKIYNENNLSDIFLRFEEPSFKSRWDMPLYLINPFEQADKLNFENMYREVILSNKALVPNIATKAQKVPQNYIQEIDNTTAEIIKDIMSAQQNEFLEYKFPGCHLVLEFSRNKYSTIRLHKIRRQFINMMNNNFSSKIDRTEQEMLKNIAELFLNYIQEQYTE